MTYDAYHLTRLDLEIDMLQNGRIAFVAEGDILYVCICLLGGFISCQTNESITQDEEIQTIMEGISNQAGQEKNPYLTAGDKTYIIGTQDGNFPDS